MKSQYAKYMIDADKILVVKIGKINKLFLSYNLYQNLSCLILDFYFKFYNNKEILVSIQH